MSNDNEQTMDDIIKSYDLSQGRIVVIDADLVAYMCAAAGQQSYVEITHRESGNKWTCKNKTEFFGRSKKTVGGKLLKLNQKYGTEFEPEEFDVEQLYVPEPISHVKFSIKRQIEGFRRKCNGDSVILVLGEGHLNREDIPLPAKDKNNIIKSKYKGGRVGGARPIHLKEAREYVQKMGAITINSGIEADDFVTMLQWQGHLKYLNTGNINDNNIILVSADKDAATSDGWLYNPQKMAAPQYINGMGNIYLNKSNTIKGHGLLFKYNQILLGDSADTYFPKSIPSFKGRYGDTSAFKDLLECETEEDLIKLTVKKYKEYVPEPCTYLSCFGEYETDDWKSWLHKMSTLVHMLRWDGDNWTVEKRARELGLGELFDD